MRPGFHVPVSFVSLLVTGTIVISWTFSFYLIMQEYLCRRTCVFERVMRMCYVISFIVPRMSSSRDVKSRDCMRSYTIRLTYVIHLFITVSSLLQCKGICVTRVHIMKCRHFTFKLMIKIECNGRRISAKEISLTIDETCTQKSSTYLPFSYFYQSQRDNCNLLNIFVLSH